MVDANDLKRRIADCKRRRQDLVVANARNRERKEQARKRILEIEKECKDTYGVSIAEVPEYIDRKGQEIESLVSQYEQELTAAEERMGSLEG